MSTLVSSKPRLIIKIINSCSPVSFTGSEAVGREVNKNVAARFGQVILELGGNNGNHFGIVV